MDADHVSAWSKGGDSFGAARTARCSVLPTIGPKVIAFLFGHAERTSTPADVRECWIAAGRRAGKSRIAALVGTHRAISFDAATLAPGELAVVPLIAADRSQARAVMSYVRGICALPSVKPWVGRVLRDSIELKSGVSIEVMTASFRTVRGYTVISAVLDEVAFWRDEATSANPDSEIIAALRPAMATVPGALLVAISSPYARTGEFHRMHDRYYGVEDESIIVWNADSRSLNPSLPERIVERAYEEDAAVAASEYGRDGRVVFRSDVAAFLDPEAVRAVTVADRRELPPTPGIAYKAFTDPSGGRQDSFTLAIAHREGDVVVLDALRERRPPFSPDEVVEQFARFLASYGVRRVTGDRYGGEWPRERFRVHGITYEPAKLPRSDLYKELLPLVNAGRVQLLDDARLRAQLIGLERRTARGGRDSIDHAPGAHDDVANAAAGAVVLAAGTMTGVARTSAVAVLGGEHMGQRVYGGADFEGYPFTGLPFKRDPRIDEERAALREKVNKKVAGYWKPPAEREEDAP
jgi:hypothetical protein